MRFSVVAIGTAQALEPDDDDAKKHVAALQVGERIELRPIGPQSKFRKHVYATLNDLQKYRPGVNWRAYLAIVAGNVDLIRANGQPIIVPRSISDMPAAEFEAFWEEASQFVLEKILPPQGEDAAADAIRNAIQGGSGAIG